MRTLFQDLQYGIRLLAGRPGFTIVAVLTLAIGIGANTAIFSVVNGVLLRPLPYREPGKLVRVYSEFLGGLDLRKFWVSPPEFMEIQKDARSWESIGAWSSGGVNVGTTGDPIRVTSAAVTRGLIDALGVQPAMGRNFTPEEDVKGGPLTALISDALWRRAFGGQPDIIGRQIQINARPFTVIGVMPRGYVFPPGTNDPADVWVSFQFDPANPGGRSSHFLYLIGRLKQGVTIEQARAEMASLMAGWKNEKPSMHLLNPEKHPVLMVPLHEDVVASARPAVLMLLGAVGFVLLIACVNVANLMLARSEARHREFAVRLALGAGRRRILRQFLTEGMLMVLFGAGAGLLLAYGGLKLVMAVAPASVPRTGEIGIDLPVLAFTLGISILSVFIFALAPMAQIHEQNLSNWLRGAGLRTAGGAGRQTLRKILVITEIALAVVLVIGSGLMIRAFWKLRQVELGFNPQGVLSFSLALPQSRYQNPDRLRFATALQERLAALPGVKSAARSSGLPPLRPLNANDTDIEDYKATPEGPAENVDFWNIVTEDYFKTMGIRTVEGRTFELADRAETAQRVVVVNQAMARRFWQGSPVGRRVNPSFADPPVWFTVVGVVEDTKNIGVDKPAGTELYFPLHQAAAAQSVGFGNMNFVVRTEGNPTLVASAVRSAVRELDPGLPVYGLQTMSDIVADSLVRPRFLSLLLATFSVIALVLAAVGIYGVMSYTVSQRTQEIGIRMALGASRRDVLRLVVGQGLVMSLSGVGIGILGAFLLTRVMAGLLFEVSSTDPVTFTSVVVLLAAVALAACLVPARRATKVDPMVALRYE
ncbi:MAG TPA: ABC transporter permease [Blastocatellia bacterium]|nr:ABC transporter permease [Blastocatellia bacterium]